MIQSPAHILAWDGFAKATDSYSRLTPWIVINDQAKKTWFAVIAAAVDGESDDRNLNTAPPEYICIAQKTDETTDAT